MRTVGFIPPAPEKPEAVNAEENEEAAAVSVSEEVKPEKPKGKKDS